MPAVFTTEPMINRALAAEIRHDPSRFTALIETTLKMASGMLGGLTEVRCEGVGGIDILLTYDNEETRTTVGLETKLDHELSDAQLEKELNALAALADNGGGHLLFVLPEVTDAPQFPDANVLSWHEVLASFDGSRLTAGDIDGMPLTKRRVERHLEAMAFKTRLDDPEWDVIVHRGGGGNPSIQFRSPELASGREIRGQIQVTGRGMPKDKDDLRLEYHIGIQIYMSNDDFPSDGGESAPAWVDHLSTLRKKVVPDSALGRLAVSRRPAPERSDEKKAEKPNPYWDSKIVVADEHLDGERWLIKGYTNGWALGIKSRPHTLAELPDLCTLAATVLNAWLAAERELSPAEGATDPSTSRN